MIKFSPKMRTKKKKTIAESDEDDDPNIKDLADLDLGRIVRKSLNRMTNEQLIGLIASVDTETKQQKAGEKYHYYDDDDRAKFYEDYSENKLQHLINNIPKVKSLIKERDDLKAYNKELATENYAREPEHVRNRMRLHELIDHLNELKISITTTKVRPIMDNLKTIEHSLQARASSTDNEQIQQDFFAGKISHDEFLGTFIKTQKELIKRRLIVDRFVKERMTLELNVPKLERGQSYGPKPMPRQRRRSSLLPVHQDKQEDGFL